MAGMWIARLQDAAEIWGPDEAQYPQGGAVQGFTGFLLRIKASICIALGRERRDHGFEAVPVWVGPLSVSYSYDGPSANWSELGTPLGWRGWWYCRYQNGI